MPRTDAEPAHPLFAFGVAGVTLLGVAAVWTVLNLRLGGLNGWLGGIAALDAVLMLRLARAAPGRRRAALATAATLAAALLVAYLTASLRTGMLFGLDPLQSVASMSPAFAWTLTLAAGSLFDLVLVVAALALAWWLGR